MKKISKYCILIRSYFLVAVLPLLFLSCNPLGKNISSLVLNNQNTPDVNFSTVVFSPLSVVADGISTATISVTLLDSTGNAVSGKIVKLTSSRGNSDTISGPNPQKTDFMGRTSFTVKSTTIGQADLIASIPENNLTLTQVSYTLFYALPGVPSSNLSNISFTPLTVPADGVSTSTITVTILDTSGNPVNNKALTLISSRGATDTILGPSPATTNASGQTTFTIKSSTVGQSTLTAAVPEDGVTIQQKGYPSFGIPLGIPNASISTMSFSPLSVPADGTSTSTVTVTILDAGGNAVPGQTVSLSSNRNALDTITGPSALTDASGQTTFTIQSAATGQATLTATVPASGVTLTQKSYPNFSTVLGIPNADLSTLSFSPTSVQADGSTLMTVTVTILDAGGNVLNNKSVTLQSSRGGSDTITTSPATTNASGQATFTIKSSTTGQAILTAAVPASSVTLNQKGYPNFSTMLGVPSVSLSTLSFSPISVQADGVTTSTATVTILDAGGLPLSGKAVTLVSDRGASDTITGPSALTDASGQTSFTIKSSTVGQATLTAAVPANGATLNQKGFPSFTTILGIPNPSLSTLSFSPISVPANGTTTSTVTATILDAGGNPLSGKAVTLVSDRTILDTISGPTPATTNASGQTTFTIKSSTVGQATLAAAVPASSVTLNQQVYPGFTTVQGIPNANLSTLSFSPLSVEANGIATSTATVTILDAGGTPLSGKTVTLVSDRGALDTITGPSPATTDASGQTTFTIKSSTVGQATLTAAVPASSVTIAQKGYPNFSTPMGIPNASLSTVSVSLLSVPADGTSVSTVTITILDAGGNAISGKTVSLTSDRAATDTISAASPATTNAFGQTTFTIKSSTTGQATLTAIVTNDNITLNDLGYTLFYVPLTTPSSSLSSLTYYPLSVAADGVSTSTITVTLLDASNNPVTGKAVTLTSSRGATDTITGPTPATTNAFGQTTFTIKSSTLGDANLTAAVPASSVTLNQLGHTLFLGKTPDADFQARFADGISPGTNGGIPTSVWKNLFSSSTINDAGLYNFLFTSDGWLGDGSVGNPYRLKTTSTNFLALGYNYNYSTDATFEAWVYFANVNTDFVFSNLISSPSNAGMLIGNNNVGMGVSPYIWGVCNPSYSLTPNWYHLISVLKKNNSVNFYINGVSECGGALLTSYAGSTLPIKISGIAQIADVRIYKYALSAADVTSNFNATISRFVSGPPSAPTGLTATSVANTNTINLSWTALATTPIKYIIQRSTDNFATVVTNLGTLFQTTVQTALADVGLGNTTYQYRVQAFNAAGGSSFSNIASASTPNCKSYSATDYFINDYTGNWSGKWGNVIIYNSNIMPPGANQYVPGDLLYNSNDGYTPNWAYYYGICKNW